MHEVIKAGTPKSLFELFERFKADAPLKRIFQLAFDLGCKTILLEGDHVDPEYTSEFKLFYKDLHKKHSDKTERLHFFDTENLDETNIHNNQESYLGYCVLRPFTPHRVVNAVIKPYHDKNNPKKTFLICSSKFNVEGLSHIPLHVEGFPFFQQDGQIGCCSDVALMTTDKFISAKNFSFENKTIEQISKLTAQVPNEKRDTPTSGLFTVQIVHALKEMGYAPLIYRYGKNYGECPPERVLYHYLESEIPVILGFHAEKNNGHAVTVIGHSFEPDMWKPVVKKHFHKETVQNYYCSTDWIQNFIIQDDRLGPYLLLPKDLIWEQAKENLSIIVPLPKKINMLGEAAELYAYRMLSDKVILNMINDSKPDGSSKMWHDIFRQHLEENKLVLRTYLINSNDFKKSFSLPQLTEIYKNLPMPPKIWLTEISTPELFCQPRLRIGEVVIDSTASSKSVKWEHAFLSIHVPGLIVTRDIRKEEAVKNWQPYSVNDDGPCQHLTR
jgi:hypothetical protein